MRGDYVPPVRDQIVLGVCFAVILAIWIGLVLAGLHDSLG